MYASIGTPPDISFAISTLSQFLDNPGHIHWEAVKHVFHYLLGMKDLQLTFGQGKHGLEGYTDADSASQEHRHAISGYIFIINGGAVSHNKNSSHYPQLKPNTLLQPTLPRKQSGFETSLVKSSAPPQNPQHFTVTISQPSPLLLMAIIMLTQNTSTYTTTSSDSSSIMDHSSLFIVLPTT